MSQYDWRDQTEPFILPRGDKSTEDAIIQAEPNTGDVQIQIKNSSETWFTPTSAENTITEDGYYRIYMSNTDGYKIIATGDAKFKIIHNVY